MASSPAISLSRSYAGCPRAPVQAPPQPLYMRAHRPSPSFFESSLLRPPNIGKIRKLRAILTLSRYPHHIAIFSICRPRFIAINISYRVPGTPVTRHFSQKNSRRPASSTLISLISRIFLANGSSATYVRRGRVKKHV